MRVKVAKWGNSVAVRLPRSAVELADVEPGSSLELTASDGRLVFTRIDESRYAIPTLGELIAEMDRLGPASAPATIEWGRDRGTEVLRDD